MNWSEIMRTTVGEFAGREELERFDIDVDEALGVAADFVGTPSGTGHEGELARLIVARGREAGLGGRVQQIGEDRFNAIVQRDGDPDKPSLLFNGHMDTSYTGQEEHLNGPGYEPVATFRDGWLFGLGSLNMKTGLAAAFVAATAISRRYPDSGGRIQVAGVAGEIEKAAVDQYQGREYSGYGFGTRQLIAHGATADYGIVCEPTGFKVSHGQLGTVWAKVTVHGQMKHTVFATGGVDHAVYKGMAAVQAIRDWGAEYQVRNTYEGQPAAVSVGAVSGGWPWRISRTPHDCTMYVDVRITPEQRPAEVLRELEDVVRGAVVASGGDQRVTIEPYVIAPSILADPDAPVFGALRDAHDGVFGEPAETLFRGPMADSGHMNAAGIQTATYGLGPLYSMDDINPDTGEAGEHIRVERYLELLAVYLRTAEKLTDCAA